MAKGRASQGQARRKRGGVHDTGSHFLVRQTTTQVASRILLSVTHAIIPERLMDAPHTSNLELCLSLVRSSSANEWWVGGDGRRRRSGVHGSEERLERQRSMSRGPEQRERPACCCSLVAPTHTPTSPLTLHHIHTRLRIASCNPLDPLAPWPELRHQVPHHQNSFCH